MAKEGHWWLRSVQAPARCLECLCVTLLLERRRTASARCAYRVRLVIKCFSMLAGSVPNSLIAARRADWVQLNRRHQ